jgi:Tol biopolymer transport system component
LNFVLSNPKNAVKRSKFVPALLLALLLAPLLAACGGDAATLTPLPATATTGTTNQPVQGTTQEADPIHAPTPAVTFPNQPAATATATPKITAGGYGPLPTPPATLNPTTTPFQAASNPVLPKGSLVVGTASGLYLVNPKDGTAALIAGKAGFSDPKVAPDGTHIAAFRQDPISRQSQLVLVDLAGNLKPVNFDSGGVALAASWSPDGKTLALTRATDTNNDGLADEFDQTTLVLYDLASGKQQALGEGGWASWSPDGVRLAYLISGPFGANLDPTTRQLERSPNALAVYNVTNKGKRTLLESKGQMLALANAGFAPIPPDQKLDLRYFKAVTWHPDSAHITATADVTGPNGLRAGVVLTLTLDDTTPRVLTAAGDAAGQVAWAPDGKELAFETQPQYPVTAKSAHQVAVLNDLKLDNSFPVKTLLGQAATRSETRRPAWSPDSQELAYLGNDTGILFVADASGQQARSLLAGCLGFDWF